MEASEVFAVPTIKVPNTEVLLGKCWAKGFLAAGLELLFELELEPPQAVIILAVIIPAANSETLDLKTWNFIDISV
jgi:hypothetical protein